ncbi:MAG: DUF4407 domain-containing protein [Bacteroidota bacterium]
MDKIKYFFWLCSGSSIRHLEECPSEGTKHAGVGATIFFTSIFAALAAFYALYTVFDNPWVAGVFGVLWGLMIFNLDRYIVSSMRKHKHQWKNILHVLPRIALAVLISVVIAKPLELKIFEKEIDAEIIVMQEEQRQRNEQLLRLRYEQPIQDLETSVSSLKQELVTKQSQRDTLRAIARREADGTGGTGKRNPGPIYRIKKADADQADQELKDLSAFNVPLIAEKQESIKKLEQEFAEAKGQMVDANLTGLASRLVSLDRIAAENSAIWWGNLFIMLLFIVVECSPILVKLMTGKGPYDHMLDLEEYKFESSAYKRRALVNKTLRKKASRMDQEEEAFILDKLNTGLDEV